jgi:hypothetical protein
MIGVTSSSCCSSEVACSFGLAAGFSRRFMTASARLNILLATFRRLPAKLWVGGGGTIPCDSIRLDGNAIDPRYIVFSVSKPLKPRLGGCGDAERFVGGF